MKPSYVIALAFVTCLACKDISYVQANTEIASQYGRQGEAMNSDEFYISIELAVHASQVVQYPVTAAALKRALDTWSQNLPIRSTLYVEGIVTPAGTTHFLYRWNMIEILIDDMNAPVYGLPEQLLGIWLPDEKRIILDAPELENDPELAYSTALHELGHMFGVPHIVNADQMITTGNIVLPPDQNAESYVMYPAIAKGQSQNVLSSLEIKIARERFLDNLTIEYKSEKCHLTSEPYGDTMSYEDSSND